MLLTKFETFKCNVKIKDAVHKTMFAFDDFDSANISKRCLWKYSYTVLKAKLYLIAQNCFSTLQRAEIRILILTQLSSFMVVLGTIL